MDHITAFPQCTLTNKHDGSYSGCGLSLPKIFPSLASNPCPNFHKLLPLPSGPSLPSPFPLSASPPLWTLYSLKFIPQALFPVSNSNFHNDDVVQDI